MGILKVIHRFVYVKFLIQKPHTIFRTHIQIRGCMRLFSLSPIRMVHFQKEATYTETCMVGTKNHFHDHLVAAMEEKH